MSKRKTRRKMKVNRENLQVPDTTLDPIRRVEEKNFKESKKYLGESFSLYYHLLALYETFHTSSQKFLGPLSNEKIIPIFHSLHFLEHEAVMATLTLLRGHVAESAFYSRRAIEVCAAVVAIYRREKRAKAWMGAAEDFNKYSENLDASGKVQQYMPDRLKERYDYYNLHVHPTPLLIAPKSSFGEDRIHRIDYFDLATDGDQTMLVMQFMIIAEIHSSMMHLLMELFVSGNDANKKEWSIAIATFESLRIHVAKSWLPVIKHLLPEDNQVFPC